MLNRIFRIMLIVLSILFVSILAYSWIIKDMTRLTKADSLLLYGTGSMVILSWLLLSVMGMQKK
jgi:hypothetical protein